MFEWEDKSWFPKVFRDMQTAYIGWLVAQFGVYKPIQEKFADAATLSQATCWTDLASGNGGPALSLLSELKKSDKKWEQFPLELTDLYPGFPTKLPLNVHAKQSAVNALTWQSQQKDIRTLFNAYHHFDANQKAQLIQQHSKKGFFVAEVLQPNVLVLLKIIFTTTIGQILLAPFVKPFSWTRLFFTYIFPINLLTITWDGIVSVLKSESHTKMSAHAKQHLPAGCLIKSGIHGPWWAPVSWFYIVPANHE